MKERASWPMKAWEVRAILDGRKTQTRRVVMPQPPDGWFAPEEGIEWRGEEAGFCGRQRVQVMGSNGEADVDVEVIAFPVQHCPYGVPGDRLWVREPWHTDEPDLAYARAKHEDAMSGSPICYAADVVHDNAGCIWRPSIHMPRWASRITLEIVSVRVERLQEITEADADAEGIIACDGLLDEAEICRHANAMGGCPTDSRPWFATLWNSIYAKRAPWESNPWVWAIEFRVIEEGSS
jgi:hypothetical protein